jgi:CheY-like chemotaxis protein
MPAKTVHVLLVEDDDVDAEEMLRSFDRLAISNPITVVPDGYAALNILRGEEGYERLPRPYIILLDLNTPRMNGLEFLRVIRNDDELRQSVVFVLTTSDNEADMEAAYASNVAGYFLKARTGEAFLDLPKMMTNYWRLVEFPTPK